MQVYPEVVANCFIYTAVLDDTEFNSVLFSLTFPDTSNDQTLCAPIPIMSDEELEGLHDFTVAIISAGSPPHATINPLSTTTTVVIVDDERKLFLGVHRQHEPSSNRCVFDYVQRELLTLSPSLT